MPDRNHSVQSLFNTHGSPISSYANIFLARKILLKHFFHIQFTTDLKSVEKTTNYYRFKELLSANFFVFIKSYFLYVCVYSGVDESYKSFNLILE